MLAQGNKCACCGVRFDNTKSMQKACIDHDHDTGKVRDVICGQCNIAAGNVLDSAERARWLYEYLKKWDR